MSQLAAVGLPLLNRRGHLLKPPSIVLRALLFWDFIEARAWLTAA